MPPLLPRFVGRRRRAPALPAGTRVYAIGDVHGEALLLSRLLARIEADNAARGPSDTAIVLVGDVIDRGPFGAELATALSRLTDPRFTVLKGNHEAAMVAAWDGDEEAAIHWLRYGGDATLAGFLGAPAPSIDDEPAHIWSTIRRAVPLGVINWMRELPLTLTLGDYLFVHAGIRPGIAIDRQHPADLLRIREPFLSSPRAHGRIVVHGHSKTGGEIDRRDNRIGIDTGAYDTGILTALGLERDEQWTLSVGADEVALAA